MTQKKLKKNLSKIQKPKVKERILNSEERSLLIECATDIAVLTKIYKDTLIPLLLILKDKGYITDEDLTEKQDKLGIKRSNSNADIEETDELQVQSKE